MNLLIEVKRKGYSPKECGRTMTAREIIAYLEQFDDETPVYLQLDQGYTYSPIREHYFLDGDED